ncbi:ATP-binding protein [Ruegeria pomeroyi]|nr:ATP-binding protein [Ruegeria pomeroyi]
MARSITDEEISLIKAMLARGERNVDIQFYFNRQDRPVNSGRISQIRNGTYGPKVAAASQADLDAFLAQFQAQPVGVGVPVAAPTIAERARLRLEQRADGNWYLADGETSEQECKEHFDPKKMNPIVRAIAALANNKGGFVFLGIRNADCRVVGLADNQFSETDIVRIADKVKHFLTPTPDFVKDTIAVDGMSVGIIYVEKFDVPPVIVCRDGDGLEDGTILFRYPGQSAKIKFGDLHAMLRERDQASHTRLLQSAQRLSDIGIDRSMIIDTDEATLETSDTKLMIDRALADQLDFIRQGEFEEVAGAPALRLVGDVRAVDAAGGVQERIEGRTLTADEILRSFLRQDKVRSPIDYVKVSALVQRQWLPIFYFAHLSDSNVEEVIAELDATEAVYAASKTNALERLRGDRSAYQAATGRSAEVLAQILAGEIAEIDLDDDARAAARAVQALPDGFENLEPVMVLLETLFELAGSDSARKGEVFRASARVDELLYRPEENNED